MSQKSDNELIKVVTIDRGDYQEIAIEIAEAELAKRNIDPKKLEKAKEDLVQEREEQDEIAALIVPSLTRFINCIVDVLCWFVIVFIIDTLIGRLVPIHPYLILGVTFFGYYLLMEWKFGKTIGKFITKTRVVLSNGEKPKMKDIISRNLYRAIPLDVFSYLFNPVGFHDRLSKTIVVKDKN